MPIFALLLKDSGAALCQRMRKFGFRAWLLVVCNMLGLVHAQPASPWNGVGVTPKLESHHVAACTACHGPQGRATPSGYFPRLAGKPQEYLYQQLLNFRDGRRSYPLMGHLLRHLDNDQLQGMAQYFAQLRIPYPSPEPVTSTSASLERGAQLIQQGDVSRGLPACTACHGGQLMGVLPAVPGLLGLSRDYLNSQLGAWKVGRRSAKSPDCMAQIAQKLLPQDVADITAWLTAQTVPIEAAAESQETRRWPMACGAAPQHDAVAPDSTIDASGKESS